CNFFLVDFSSQKNHTEVHMLFQVLSGFKPIFYTTHPNEEPEKLTISVFLSQCQIKFIKHVIQIRI
ncbi:MAG: hypothetical protein SPL23_10360, partial [Lachnospiraceae bacterium]|nr:hypothetical protein [Lachnospiraceae bacterium]